VTVSTATHRRRWLILAVLCLSLLIVVVDNTIVNVALPTLSEELDASVADLQWVVDAYTLVFAALLLAFGHAGDRFGRRLVLQLGLVVFAATSVLAAYSTSSGQLITARALMGIGAAMVFPATLAILVNVFDNPRERAAAIGIWSAMTGVAVALGPVLGGYLLEHFSWGSIFLVNVPIAAVALVAGFLLIPPSRDPHAGRMDHLGLVLSAAGVGLLVWSIIEAPHRGWTSPGIVAAGLGALALLAAFVLWERRVRDPLLDVRLFRNLRFSGGSISVTAAFFALFGFIFLITQFLQLVQGYSPFEAGLRTLPFAIATGVTSPLAIVLMHRIGTTFVVAGGLAVMAVGFVLAATLTPDTPYVGMTVISMVTIAVGLGLVTGPATEAILGALPVEKAGVGSAVNDTTRELGGTLGVAVVGSVFASVYGAAIVTALTPFGLPGDVVDAAQESLAAGLGIAATLPAEATAAVQQAFTDGLSAGSLVAGGVAAVGAVLALLLLPARAAGQRSRQVPVSTGADDSVATAGSSSAAVSA
jgi:EmrB/QacA subfamily drug resistance transporter